MYRFLYIVLILFFFSSCKDTKKDRAYQMMKEWLGKEIIYPPGMRFTVLDKDTCINESIFNTKYKIVAYVDSVGCISCKLNIQRWKELIAFFDSIDLGRVSIQLIFQPYKTNDLYLMLRRNRFLSPFFIDREREFYKMNHLSFELDFRTFLLDKQNRIIAIGNPVQNSRVKDLYIKIIKSDKTRCEVKTIQTEVAANKQFITLGNFDWEVKQDTVFYLKNMGNMPLVINDVITSCGCTSVEYAKEPIRPGKSVALKVTYQAEHPEYFDKTITVYCNALSSPIRLKINGNAQ